MKKTFLLLSALAAAATAPFALAADGTWDGDTNTTFSDVNNWVGGILPASSTATGNNATFGASLSTYQPTLTVNRSVSGLVFQKTDGGWTLGGSGQTLTIGLNGIADSATSGNTTISANVILGANQAWSTQGGTIKVDGGTTINANRSFGVTSGNVIIASLNADTTARTFTTTAGAGTLTLSGAAGANLQGQFNHAAGTLIVGNNSAMGSGTVKFGTSAVTSTFQASRDVTIANALSWTGQAAGSSNTFSGSNNITFTGNSTGAPSGSNVFITNSLDSGKKLLFSGTSFTLSNSTSTVTLNLAGTGVTEFSAGISNGGTATSGAIIISNTGNGMTILSGTNTYNGTTTVSSGVLLLNSANALPGGIGSTGGTSNLALSGGVVGLGTGDFTRALGIGVDQVSIAGGGFAAYGADRTVNLGGAGAGVTWNNSNFMTGTGTVFILGSSTANATVTFVNPINLQITANLTRTIQVDDGSAAVDAVLSGAIIGTTATVAFNKTGNGTLSSTGNNTYLGSTTVSAGTLLINGNSTSANGSVNVASGATLGGSGKIGGATTIDGTLSPGNSPGLLTFVSSLTLNGTAATRVEINGNATRGTDYDGVNVGTSLAYGGNLTLVFGTTFASGNYTFNLFDFASQSGSFANVALSGNYTGAFSNSGGNWTLTQANGFGGNNTWTFAQSTGDLGLNVVPEPATWALLAISLTTVMVLRRRRT